MGDPEQGGVIDESIGEEVISDSNPIVDIVSTDSAFAAITSNGDIVSMGESGTWRQ